nr:glycosyltransferase family 2 protein [Falsirhodobacter deserti]
MRHSLREWRIAYGLWWKRQRLLRRARRARHDLQALCDRTASIRPGAILSFATIRNERSRLPFFLDHCRRLGVRHFLIVDNHSNDGSCEYLRDQPDVSLWSTKAGYKAARFGLDWTTWLLMRHGDGHWCLTLDADELLIYPHWETRDLHALTNWLDRTGQQMFPAMMLDLFPKGPVGLQPEDDDPLRHLCWFDHGNYSVRVQPRMRNLWIQGGPRSRALLDDPRRGPTLNKVPLIRWRRHYAYVNSTHSALPRRLNRVYAEDGGEMSSGVLLHTKFLDSAPARAIIEKARGEHFFDGNLYAGYYDAVAANPDLWHRHAQRLTGWRQLESLGLMSRGGWA